MGMRVYVEEDSAASEIMVEAKDALFFHGGAISESVNDATHILVDTIADLAMLKGSQNNLLTPARLTSKCRGRQLTRTSCATLRPQRRMSLQIIGVSRL